MNSVSGHTFPTINPCTGEVIVQIQEGDKVEKVVKLFFSLLEDHEISIFTSEQPLMYIDINLTIT